MKNIDREPIHIGKVSKWKGDQIQAIHSKLEVPNWAPWLTASKESLSGRAEVFPEGQLVITDVSGEPVASLSMNRTEWNGDPATLPSWDDVAGDPTTYEKTYQPKGNTLAMMSMNVAPAHQGEGLARQLIVSARDLSKRLGVSLIGSFRPNQYGQHKATHGGRALSFEQYSKAVRPEDGLPIDGWLRNLFRNGMQPVKVDTHAMRVTIPLEEFYGYQKTYHPGQWREVSPGKWECGEVGSWQVDAKTGTATYTESNLWGKIK